MDLYFEFNCVTYRSILLLVFIDWELKTVCGSHANRFSSPPSPPLYIDELWCKICETKSFWIHFKILYKTLSRQLYIHIHTAWCVTVIKSSVSIAYIQKNSQRKTDINKEHIHQKNANFKRFTIYMYTINIYACNVIRTMTWMNNDCVWSKTQARPAGTCWTMKEMPKIGELMSRDS